MPTDPMINPPQEDDDPFGLGQSQTGSTSGPNNIVDFADAVERTALAANVPAGMVLRSVSVSETEVADGSARSRRATFSIPRGGTVAQQPLPTLDYLSGGLAELRPDDGDMTVLVFNDTQFPYEDKTTWALLLAFARDFRPDITVAAGDIDDLPTVSRHPRKVQRELPGGLQAEMAYSFARKCELRRALGPVGRVISAKRNRYLAGFRLNEVIEVEGNHDLRLRTHLEAMAPQMAHLHRVGDDTTPVNSIQHLQRYEEIGWRYISGYPHAHLQLAEDLDARHGEHARKGAGNSVRQMMDKLPGVSIIQGHTHRQGIVGEAVHSLNGPARTAYGIENGTISAIDTEGTGMDYTTFPDWAPGWMVVTLHADGTWSPELVTVDRINRTARFRGRRWTAASE